MQNNIVLIPAYAVPYLTGSMPDKWYRGDEKQTIEAWLAGEHLQGASFTVAGEKTFSLHPAFDKPSVCYPVMIHPLTKPNIKEV